MKRKTNLFYLTGDDSKFITFSNYGESMTGNFLATDWKLFPSKFICMYIKFLDVNADTDSYTYEKRKEKLIKYLASYYENKLAFLRDYCNSPSNNLHIENNLFPLNYLLEALYRINGSLFSENPLLNYRDIRGNNDNVQISFIGDITEQDYNGTYTDIINVITSHDKARGNIILSPDTDERLYYIDYKNSDGDSFTEFELSKLYGWVNRAPGYGEEYVGPKNYEKVNPTYDITDSKYNQYNINSIIEGISTENHSENENIKFNIIIPLYDLVNINSSTNNVNIVENEKIKIGDDELDGISLNNNGLNYVKNVPLGIWFSDEDPIELKRDNYTGYAPSWSLLLSSQFKPFPYSKKVPTEITQDSTKEAFATYSQVLIRQNRLLDTLEQVTEKIVKLNKRIDLFESKLNSIGTSYTVDKMHSELINFEQYSQNNFNKFKEEIYSYITNNWKGYIS